MCFWEKLYSIFFGILCRRPANAEDRLSAFDSGPDNLDGVEAREANSDRPERHAYDIAIIQLPDSRSSFTSNGEGVVLENISVDIREYVHSFRNGSLEKDRFLEVPSHSGAKSYTTHICESNPHLQNGHEIAVQNGDGFPRSGLHLPNGDENIKDSMEREDFVFPKEGDTVDFVSEYLDSSSDDEEYDEEFQSQIDLLPYEILNYIFSFINLQQLCLRVGLVCKKWNTLINDPIHWQQLIFRTGVTSSNVMKCIEKAPFLKDLTFYWRTDLTTVEVLEVTINCPLLQKLHLPYCDNVDQAVIRIICDNCHHLTLLNLEGCRLVDNDCVPYLCKLTKLRALYLSHCAFIKTEGVEMLATTLPHLQELNTDGIPDISDSAVESLVRHHSRHLVMLCLDGASLTDSAFHKLAKCRLLKTLCVSFGERLSDRSLTYVKGIPSLETLRLCKGGDFTSEGLVTLFSDKTLSNLVHLDLSDCLHLQDSGIHALVQSCGAKLKQLYLCWCWNISDVGLKDIVGNCPNLEVLDLMGVCDVGGNSLVLIPVTMPKLRVLDLSQCHQVTDELLVDVVQQLPQLVVFNYYGEKIAYCPGSGQRVHRFHSSLVRR